MMRHWACLAFGFLVCGVIQASPWRQLSYEFLDGHRETRQSEIAFYIVSKSADDIEKAMRCATLLASLSAPLDQIPWRILVAWPRISLAERAVAQHLARVDFMRDHIAIPDTNLRHAPFLTLLDRRSDVVWISSDVPLESEWEEAKAVLERALRP